MSNLKEIAEKTGDAIVIHYVSLDDLEDTFLDGNSKKHDTDKIIESIRRYGFRDPIAFDASLNDGNGGIVEGNGRLESLIEMKSQNMNLPRGLKEGWLVPVLFGVNASSEAEAVAFSVEHNWSVMWGSEIDLEQITSMFDDTALKQQLEWLDVKNSLPISIGNDLDELLESLEEGETETVEKEVIEDEPPEDVETRVKQGDVWQLGRHRIYCGDSTDEEKIRKFLGDRVPTFIWSDAPYGMRLDCDFSAAKSNRDFAAEKGVLGGRKYENVIGDHEDFDPTFFLKTFKAKEQFWWGANYYAERIEGKNDGSWLVWDKRLDETMDRMYGSCFELCWSKTKHKQDMIRIKWAGIFGTEKEDIKNRVHPTQKPIALAEWCFEKYGKEDDFIFDPFLGSGISIIAAERIKGDRVCYGVELSPKYCDVILQRWENLTGQKAKFLKNVN